MADPDTFMRRAIALSRQQMIEHGAAPFAAVVVKDGEIVGEGVNNVVNKCDPTSHGEVEAIRDAGRRLGTWDLSGCDLYTTCEPCSLCVSAMSWAKISRLYYANTLADCEEIGFDLKPLRDLVSTDLRHGALRAERVLPDEAHSVLQDWTRLPTFNAFQ
jgi:tRNA(Arg) A34 adenosine deaminase TadA